MTSETLNASSPPTPPDSLSGGSSAPAAAGRRPPRKTSDVGVNSWPELDPEPPEMSTADVYDCIVIGAGVQGSFTAYELAKRGRRTVLLEQVSGPSSGRGVRTVPGPRVRKRQ